MKPYDKYKDSGIEWIGEIPEHWEVKRLKRFAKICNGQDHKSVYDLTGEYPIFGSGGEFGRANKFIHQGPSVLLGRKGTIDKPRYIDYPFWSVDTAYYTDIYPNTNTRFFYYLCTLIQFDLYKYGSAVPSMNQETLNQIDFPAPSFEEQTTIAAYLDRKTAEIDLIIANKQKLITLYEEEKQAVINQAFTKGLNPNAKMKDSDVEWLGDIPEHWEVKKLKHIVSKIGSGVTPRGGSSVYQLSGIPFLRSQNIYFDGLELDDVAFISEEIDNNMSNSRTHERDILLNITGGSIGRCFYVPVGFGSANVNQHVCIIRPRLEIIDYIFLYYILRSNIGQLQIDFLQTGANREGLNFEQLKNFIIPLVDHREQQYIVSHIEKEFARLDTEISKFHKQIALLQEYRTTLISEVVTGKVKVC